MWCIAPETLLGSTLEVPFGCRMGRQLVLVIRGYECACSRRRLIVWTYSHCCSLVLSMPLVVILQFCLAGVIQLEFLVILEEIEWAREIIFVAKCDQVVLFLKEGKGCVPIVESGWDEDVISSTFVCFRVVLGDAWNGGHIARKFKTQSGFHHTS